MHVIRSLIIAYILFISYIPAQELVINKIEPPNWWTGMKMNSIQLMLYGQDLDNINVHFEPSGIKVKSIENIKNSGYAFVNIEIPGNLKAQTYKIIAEKQGYKEEKEFPLYKREKGNGHSGFSNRDVVYLIMPDRFSNGDKSNDNIPGLADSLNLNKEQGRHGGDIRGIINHLDYLKYLGITALWLTPVVENKTEMSYHGYGATDFYKIDPRFGTNEIYKELVSKAHQKGIKIILDHVANHFDKGHPWMKNLPVPEWIHGSMKDHKPAVHHKMVFADPYRDTSTLKDISEGWFTDYLVDINQSNTLVKNYIIQNTIWWVEYAGIDGIREDTYPYSDQKFLSDWGKIILNEYPGMNIVGEVWTGEPVFLAPFQGGNLSRGYDSHLPAVTDFALRDRYYDFLTGKGKLFNIYETLTKDYIYGNPSNLLTFIDNHDMARGLYYANGDLQKMKIVLTLLLTTRGIPQLLYGTETTLPGGESHGTLRFNFPGGFEGDTLNYFDFSTLNVKQKEYFLYLQTLLNLRKKFPALSEGRITHFPPADGIYVYFKESRSEKFMIIVNENSHPADIDLSDYNKYTGKRNLVNILNNKEYNKNEKLNIGAVESLVLKIE